MGPVNICLAIIRWLPVIFITAVVVWSYYAYVIQMCILTITNIPQKVLYLILYHPFIIMFFWSYWKAIFTEVGSVPKEFFLSVSDVEQFERSQNEENQKEILSRFARNLPVQCRTNSGAYRYCEKCKCIKPDRAHHCSVCGQCILKMDHHCPWVNNCVSFTTYKYFVLFLGYSLLYCLYVAATSLQYFILFWTGMGGDSHDLSNLHIVFVFFVAVMFAISLLTLFGYHLFLTSKNRSTLESFRAPIFASGPDKDGFSLGRKGNFMEVFGDNSKLWFLPMYSSTGDGVTYPTRVLPSPSSYHSMDTTTTATTTATNPATQPSKSVERENTNNSSNFGDGVNFPVRTIDEDYDSLLGQRQRWMEEGDMDNGGPVSGYDNVVLTRRM